MKINGLICLLAIALVIVGLAGFSANWNLAPTYAKAGETVTMLKFNVTPNSTTGTALYNITIDNPGTAKYRNVTAVTVAIGDTSPVTYSNSTFDNFPIIIIFGSSYVISGDTNITINFTVNGSLQVEGLTMQANVTALGTEENVTYDTLPINSSITTIDAAPPTTSATAVKSDGSSYTFNTWTNSNYVNVTLSCSDGGSGCSVTQYCTDTANTCTPSTTYTAGQKIQITTEGISYIRYRSNDTAGNLETINSQTIKIDTTPPTVSVTGAPSNWQNTSATAGVSCSDSGAGCNASTYRLYISTSQITSCPNDYSNYTLTSPQTISQHSWVCAAAKDNVSNIGFSSPVEFKVDQALPTVSLSLSADRIYIGNSITVNCSASSTAGIQSISVSSDDGTSICSASSTDSCAGTYKPTTIGAKTITCSVTNNAGSSKTETATLTVYSVSSRSNSFVSSISSIQASASTNRVSAGQSVSYNLSVAPNLPLITISVTFANALSGISLTASKIAAPPADAPAVPGIPSAYVKVEKNGFKDSDLSSTTLDFKVEKAWIDENGIDPEKVSVYRLENNTWTMLTTTKSTEDDKYIYYSAVSPSGLSIFAISGEKKTAAPPSEEKPPAAAEEGAKPGVDYTWIAIAVIVLIIAGGVYYYFTSKKSAKK